MNKLKIKTTIKTKSEKTAVNTMGTIESGIISYKENNNTYMYLDINRNELIRENDEINMKYSFKEKETTKGTIFIKELNKNIKLDIKTIKIEKTDYKYKVEYIIEEETFIYEITYREV